MFRPSLFRNWKVFHKFCTLSLNCARADLATLNKSGVWELHLSLVIMLSPCVAAVFDDLVGEQLHCEQSVFLLPVMFVVYQDRMVWSQFCNCYGCVPVIFCYGSVFILFGYGYVPVIAVYLS